MTNILLADDDQVLRSVLKASLEAENYTVKEAEDGREALNMVKDSDFDVIVLDIMMPELSGFEVFEHTKRYAPNTPVILMSANATFTTSIEASKAGAFDYLPKPFDLNDLGTSVKRAIKANANSNVVGQILRPEVKKTPKLLGKSPAMQDVFKIISRLSTSDLSVLLYGESGTGKEVAARTIHNYSPVKNGPFVAVNMAAIPMNLIESELFGHEKGAFTGADRRKIGRFEEAKGGTLFLDEIGDMPLEAQTRLLRVLQEEEFSPIGSNRVIQSDVRIICATHKNLADSVKSGLFRQDLYYRLNVIPIHIPSLRDRSEDIFDLACEFLDEVAPDMSFAKGVEAVLKSYDWPGNVRELKNLVSRLAVLSDTKLISSVFVKGNLFKTQKDIGSDVDKDNSTLPFEGMLQDIKEGRMQSGHLYNDVISDIERPLIEKTLQVTNGNQVQAAKILGLNRNTLRAKIRSLGLKVVRS